MVLSIPCRTPEVEVLLVRTLVIFPYILILTELENCTLLTLSNAILFTILTGVRGHIKLCINGCHDIHLFSPVYLQSALESPKRRRALKKIRGRRIAELQPLGRTLRLVAGLQTDSNHKVAQAAASCLSRMGGFKALRAKVRTLGDSLCLSVYGCSPILLLMGTVVCSSLSSMQYIAFE